MKIWYSEYRLSAKGAPNSRTEENVVGGILLKCSFEGGIGYASLTAWPELGDAPLEEQLESLRSGRETPLSCQALTCARADAELRAQKLNAFAGLQIPESHFLLTDLAFEDDVVSAFMQGYRVIKAKIGRDWREELYRLEKLAERFHVLRWRLDANAKLSFAEAISFWGGASLNLRRRIEFIEDPCPYARADWQRLAERMPVALDFERNRWSAQEPLALPYLILKPEAQDIDAIVETDGGHFEKFVVTSYMGHPLGQAWAAYRASKLSSSGKLALCGLNSHLVYQESPFSKALFSSEGTGLGFDRLLEGVDWRELT